MTLPHFYNPTLSLPKSNDTVNSESRGGHRLVYTFLFQTKRIQVTVW
jgi:hypothetical protein